jgi:phosphoribosyl 1,2-cyclic phosphodiesterase
LAYQIEFLQTLTKPLEFPQIRIDNFRKQENLQAPLACFLSHVHSDHLLGLESLKAPFVYCSSATKEVRKYLAFTESHCGNVERNKHRLTSLDSIAIREVSFTNELCQRYIGN